MSEEEPKKVVKFNAPKETPVGKFEFVIETWLRDREPRIESGSDEAFQTLALSLADGLVAYGANQKNPAIIAGMGAEFARRRREWSEKVHAAATEAEADVARTISLRYDELMKVVNRYLEMRGS